MKMISVDEALANIFDNTDILGEEHADLQSVYGKVLAEDVRSDIDIPPFHKAAMDGYAVLSRDLARLPVELTLIGNLPAGTFSSEVVRTGTCMKIMTGAPVPEGADAVVMVEDTERVSESLIRFKKGVLSGENVCRMGEDVRIGETVLHRGILMGGSEVAVCASVGKTSLRVVRMPKTGILSTGNEIVEPAQNPGKGKIRNSNGPMLYSLVRGAGCSAEYMGISDDSEEELRQAIRRGFEKDLFLLSGGVSMGDYDLIPDILQKEGGRVLFHRVRVKPGKPLLFARKDGCRIFGIPGNPVSNLTTFFLFIKPALFKMMGREDYQPRFLNARITADFPYQSGRLYVVPSRCGVQDGGLTVTPFTLNGSADITGCAETNCFMILPEGTKTIKERETVKVLLIDR